MYVWIIYSFGNSLAVHWLACGAFSVGAWVRSLDGKLKSQKLYGVAKEKNKFPVLCSYK